MANNNPAIVNITAKGLDGTNVLKIFNAVKAINYDFYANSLQIEDATGIFYFGYNTVATVTHVLAGGITTITIT